MTKTSVTSNSVLKSAQPTTGDPFEQRHPASHMPTVIILASGRGDRFAASGGTTPKLQARLMGKTVLQRTLEAVQNSGLPWHLEDSSHPGMGDSIAAAVKKTPHANGWLILPADLPLIHSASLTAVAAALAGQDVVVPVYKGQRGHPVGFSTVCRRALLDLEGDRGAVRVVCLYGAMELPVDDVGCVTDIDTVGDLAIVETLLRRMASADGINHQT